MGFDKLTPEERKAVAAKGGKAAHASGNARRWSALEAKRAGRKGGLVTQRRKREKEKPC